MLLKDIIQALENRQFTQSQIAKMLSDRGIPISQTTVSRLKNGTQIPKAPVHNGFVDLAIELGIINHRPSTHPEDLSFIEEIDIYAALGGGRLPIISSTSEDGIVLETKAVRGVWHIPSYVLSRYNVEARHVKALVKQGDAMAPTIQNGDYVFIDTRHKVPSPPGIYALEDSFGGITIRRVEVVSHANEKEIRVQLLCDNPAHAPQERLLKDIKILGRYVGRFTS